METEYLTSPQLELWGGVECTVNRVGKRYADQTVLNGHHDRIEDLDRFAELGLTALRYPALWERTAPQLPDILNWDWLDERLYRLRDLEVRPVLGLVHHGSGPCYTDLTDPWFATGLAEYAGRVAERYPWVVDWTPINEPLTTARFSGLYGLWYPHGQDEQTFARTFIHQCRAVVLSMEAIRRHIPQARLVQTDDLGKTYSSPALRYQADFENERRWLTWDLLLGLVDRHHPMWGYLRWAGIAEEELYWFLGHTCPPDVIGINHYVTSERCLDERRENYPPHTHGSNDRHRYADVEAVRVRRAGIGGPSMVLHEAWQRYGRPLAITEAHIGCTREEQVRWFVQGWNAALEARDSGIDVLAVTAWSLLGAYNWDNLLTRDDGIYEPGPYDIRGPVPRKTALARTIQELAAGKAPSHPTSGQPGWWQRPIRLLYPDPEASPKREPETGYDSAVISIRRSFPQPLLITGASGTLGRAFARLCTVRGLPHRLLSRQEMDIADPASVALAMEQLRPWAVVNTAGYVRVDDAERDAERCFRENTQGAATLARECQQRGVGLLTFSSDLVFGQSAQDPQNPPLFIESDAVSPQCVYGRSKTQAECLVQEILPDALVVRTSAFFGPWDEYDFVTVALRELFEGHVFEAANDCVISPTYVPDLVQASLDLLIDGEAGIWHLVNTGEITWLDLAQEAAARAGLTDRLLKRLLRGKPLREFGYAAPRPLYSALGTERGQLLPPLEHALDRYIHDCGNRWSAHIAAWSRRRTDLRADCPEEASAV